MKKMNKEICLTALSKLRRLEYEENQCDEYSTVINQLIHEHFYNPPLKFEELEVGMWVWDNAKKWWIKVLEIRVANNEDDVFAEGIKIIKLGYHVFNWQEFIFEENRFYRKQVKE